MAKRKAKRIKQSGGATAAAPNGGGASGADHKAGRHSGSAWLMLGAVALVVAAGAFALLHGSGGGSPSGLASAGATAAQRDEATALSSIQPVSTAPLTQSGKPVVFFMGAQYCPFCAADRWALVKATSRFGTWSGLRPLASQGGVDGFASVPTYDLVGASFQSRFISLDHKDVADLGGNPLEQLSGPEQELVNSYDQGGSIPFTVVGGPVGRYSVGLAYSPALLVGEHFAQVHSAVEGGGQTAAATAINAQANAMTALLCKLTAGQPTSVCRAPTILTLERGLA